MLKPAIGENAGKIWQTLNSKGTLALKDIKRETKLADKDIHLSLGWLACEADKDILLLLGWLARENAVAFTNDKERVKITITNKDRNI